MIPNTGMTQEDFDKFLDKIEIEKQNNKGYRVVDNRVAGYVDGVDSLEQAISFILATERFRFITMSDNVGVEFEGLFGENRELAELKLKDTITEAILSDDRVEEISFFGITRISRNTFKIELEIKNNIGDSIVIVKEVDVND